MKKSFLLAAFLFVLGSSTMGAKTITTVEKPTVEAQEEVRVKYIVAIIEKDTGFSLAEAIGVCLTEEEAISLGNLMMGYLGNPDYAYPHIEIIGECDDF